MKKGERRKFELLQIAYKMFLTRGYENTSVDEIIEAAGIAKGTFYYYFKSKEQLLEEVIGMMIEEEEQQARLMLHSDQPIPQKIMAIMAAFRPTQDEQTIGDALNQFENILMHEKINRKIIDTIIPILAEVVEAGVQEGIFCCDHIPERLRIILIVSNGLFDEHSHYSKDDITVFVDLIEKMLGAKKGTMEFVKELIRY
ncbi:MAG: TetR/AcrR family transcriptional regulator [Blautia sp.]|nr:TetR/AcrR family transcriptional regulator [Blautia sp.]